MQEDQQQTSKLWEDQGSHYYNQMKTFNHVR